MNRFIFVFILIVTFTLSLFSCKEESPSEPVKNDLSGLYIIPKTISTEGRSVQDTLEVVFGDTMNVLTLILRNEDGKEIAFPETPVYTVTGTGATIGKTLRIFPKSISSATGKENSVKISAKSGTWESKPYNIIVLPQISRQIASLIALGKTYSVSRLSQTGRVIQIRTNIFYSGKYYPGPLNSDNMTIRNLAVNGTLSDTIGTVYSKITAENIITRMTGTEKVNTTTFGWELK
ncbi:MAG: hypothetical protein LCH54_14590 [Bacteroidetes bacterium]|nr:hypothetical protein [Bacteroidota bacterium]